MTRLTKTSLFGLLGLSMAFAGSTDVLACGRGGGGFRGGYGGFGGYNGGIYSQPVYRQPIYQQPVQPVVQQQPVQPVQQQPLAQQPTQQQQPLAQQPIQQQTAPQQAVQQQAVTSQPVQSQNVQTAQAVQTQPQTAQAPAQTQTSSAAQQSALDMLSNFGGIDATETSTTTPPQAAAFSGIGTWSATLSNGASIQLDLRADNTFNWTAIKGGKQSTFSGTFTLTGGLLTLSRTDGQQLTGSLLSPGTNGFTLKLDGVKDNGVQFARS